MLGAANAVLFNNPIANNRNIVVLQNTGAVDSIDAKLYRSQALDATTQKRYNSAIMNLSRFAEKIKPMTSALKMVSCMRSHDPNYDAITRGITSGISIPELDDWIRTATTIRNAMHKNGEELVLRRESYIASLKYKHDFDISKVKKLPYDIQLVICDYIGMDTIIIASTISAVGNIEIRQFCDTITKPKMAKVICLLKDMVIQVDNVIKSQSLCVYLDNIIANGFAARSTYLSPALIMPTLDFPTKTNVKSVIAIKLTAIFDTIVSKLEGLDPTARKLMVLNIRKLAVVFKALRTTHEKKMKRKMNPDSRHLFISKTVKPYIASFMMDMLKTWLNSSVSK